MLIREEFFTMSDGVRLYTRMVLPEDNKKFPIVFIRTPYEEKRNGVPCPAEEYQDDLFIKNGYAVILQHTRGRGDSEGICVPYKERNDGLDTLEIIRTLPFYNGEIYLTGRSYLSTVHLSYLDTKPKDIKGAALGIQTDRMYFRNYRNGCCFGYCNITWWRKMLLNRYPDQLPRDDFLYRPYYKIMERMVGEDVPEYTGMLLNAEYNDFWKGFEAVNASENMTIPTLFSDGWYDFYIDGMFDMWERLPQETKKKSAFVVGPWGHAVKVSPLAEYPLDNGNAPDDYIVKFFNSIRDNTNYDEFELGKVNYYSIGGDYWTTDNKSDNSMKLYINGDNTLSDKPIVKGEQSFIYDPDRPLDYFKYMNIFKADKENKPDEILSFTSEAFENDVDFYGKIRWNMKVKTDCDDTAFFMRVYMVEDGEAYNLTETITSLSHINPDYVANDECMIDILTPPIGFRIKKGCSLRIDITSHSKRYVPHANVKGHWAKVTETKIATNTVICDEDAYIILPRSMK